MKKKFEILYGRRVRQPGPFFENLKTKSGKIIQMFDLFKSDEGSIAYLKQELVPSGKGKYLMSPTRIVVEFPIGMTIEEERKWLQTVNKLYKDLPAKGMDGKLKTYKELSYQWSLQRKRPYIIKRKKIKEEFERLSRLNNNELNRLIPETEEGKIYKGNFKKSEKIFFYLREKFNMSEEAIKKLIYSRKRK